MLHSCITLHVPVVFYPLLSCAVRIRVVVFRRSDSLDGICTCGRGMSPMHAITPNVRRGRYSVRGIALSIFSCLDAIHSPAEYSVRTPFRCVLIGASTLAGVRITEEARQFADERNRLHICHVYRVTGHPHSPERHGNGFRRKERRLPLNSAGVSDVLGVEKREKRPTEDAFTC